MPNVNAPEGLNGSSVSAGRIAGGNPIVATVVAPNGFALTTPGSFPSEANFLSRLHMRASTFARTANRTMAPVVARGGGITCVFEPM